MATHRRRRSTAACMSSSFMAILGVRPAALMTPQVNLATGRYRGVIRQTGTVRALNAERAISIERSFMRVTSSDRERDHQHHHDRSSHGGWPFDLSINADHSDARAGPCAGMSVRACRQGGARQGQRTCTPCRNLQVVISRLRSWTGTWHPSRGSSRPDVGPGRRCIDTCISCSSPQSTKIPAANRPTWQ